jgi:GT2 family glycosyltransferase
MKISVVVPTYNRNDVLMRCVNALVNQNIEKESYEVVIVDDCSFESPYNSLKKILDQNSNFKFIRHTNNKGLASSRNTGIVNSTHEIILFLDSDIVAESSFLKHHLILHDLYPNEFLAVVSNLSYDCNYIKGSNFARFMNNRYLGNKSKSELNNLDLNDLSSQYFGGGISSVKKNILLSLGMFDESFVKYGGEDEEMGYRLKNAGVRICFSENSKAIHYDTISFQRFKLKLFEWRKNAFPLIIRKHPDFFEHAQFNLLIPINLKKDRFSQILLKFLYRIIYSNHI